MNNLRTSTTSAHDTWSDWGNNLIAAIENCAVQSTSTTTRLPPQSANATAARLRTEAVTAKGKERAPASPVGKTSTLSSLPLEILESITRFTIADKAPDVSAVQLARLQRVDRQFNAVAKNVLRSKGQSEVALATGQMKMSHLMHGCPTEEEYKIVMRDIARNTSNPRLILGAHKYGTPELEVWAEQTHLRSLDMTIRYPSNRSRDDLLRVRNILSKNANLERVALCLEEAFGDGIAAIEIWDDIIYLSTNEEFRKLTSLSSVWTMIGDGAVTALAESQVLTRLTSLDLTRNEISDEGARALIESQTLSGLTSLNLSENDIGAETEAALRERFPFVEISRYAR